jgi:hypothetical protein
MLPDMQLPEAGPAVRQSPAEQAAPTGSERTPLLVAFISALFLLLVPMRVINIGYLPTDDALRHAAKAISGKPWSEILILRDGITMDNAPGWHAFLGLLHRAFDLNAPQLVFASVVLLFLLFTVTPLFFLERKEAWPLTLLILAVGHITNIQRLLLGRPYIVSMTVLLIILFSLPALREVRAPRRTMALLSLAIAAAVWVHGSWFLFTLPLAAFLAARAWRAAVRLGACTLAGWLLGAAVTGRPVVFLGQSVSHALHSFGSLPARQMLVSEFQPFDGFPLLVVAALALMYVRWSRGEWRRELVDNPVFILAVGGYLLGYVASRFWTDWGFPALGVWMALQLQEIIRKSSAPTSLSRVLVTTGAALSFFLVGTNDFHGRYSESPAAERLSLKNPEHARWLPAPGGILYSHSMNVFYRTFFENPNAPWRYQLGFEPTMMPEADLEVYRQYFSTDGAPFVFKPWIAKMKPGDRLVLFHASDTAPTLPELRWYHATRNLWIGRLPGDS